MGKYRLVLLVSMMLVLGISPAVIGQQDPIEQVFWDMYHNNHIRDASELIEKAIEDYPKRYHYLLLRANVSLFNNDPDYALKDIDAYLKYLPPTSLTNLLKGKAYLAAKKPKDAIISFSLALEQTSEVATEKYCYLKLGEAYNQTGMYKLAKEKLVVAGDFFLFDDEYLYNLGIAQLNLNLMQEVEQTKEKLLEVHPDHPSTYAFLAEYHSRQKEFGKAIFYLEKRIALGLVKDEDYELLKTLANVTSDTLLLITAHEGLLDKNETDYSSYLILANLYHAINKNKKALAYINKALSLNYNDPVLHKTKGDIYRNTDLKAKSCDCYFIALKKGYHTNTGPDYLNIYQNKCEE